MDQSMRSSRENPHLQFGRRKILEILQEVEDGLISRKEACCKYGMAYCTLTEWFGKYGSDKYLARKQRKFPAFKKRSVVQSVLSGKMTKEEACIAFKVTRKLLRTWIQQYERDSEAVINNHLLMPKTKSAACADADELGQAKLKIEALENLIDLAEQEFKIDIRKKFGARQ